MQSTKNKQFPTGSVLHAGQSRFGAEKGMRGVFTLCGVFGIASVAVISLYMVRNGVPALGEVGLKDLLFGTLWQPTAATPSFGIAYVILTSVIGTILAIILGVPIALSAAIFLAELAPKKLVKLVQPAVELLAAVPSVVYGLLGLTILNPLMYQLEKRLFVGSDTHQFTGGANLLSAVLVLALMILPTVVSTAQTSIQSTDRSLKSASLVMGASHIQTIFHVLLPAAKSGILSGVVLGIGRALGEAMAITMVSGGSVNIPLPFNSVRFLTTAIVSEMGYASGLHRQVLFTIGLVLFVFIMVINGVLQHLIRKGGKKHE